MNPKSFNGEVSKVFNTIQCQNEEVSTAYYGKASGFHNSGMTLAYAIEHPIEAAIRSVDYLCKIRDEAHGLNCIVSLPTNITFSLSSIWFSKLLLPGKDFLDDTLWQIQETGIVQKSDYEDIIKNGYNWFYEKFFFQVVDRDDYNRYKQTEPEHVNTAYNYAYQNGFPILSNCTQLLTTPFEMLSGARGMKYFFRDIYDDINLIKEVVDALWVGYKDKIKKQIALLAKDPTFIGSLIGGWRSASNIINNKIFNELVWEHLYDLGMVFINNDKIPIFHLDEEWDREIYRFGEFPEKSILIQTDGKTDLKHLRSVLGSNYSIIGDVPPNLLVHGSVNEVKEYVTRLLGDIGQKGLFIGPGCDAPFGTSHENFIAMYKAANNWV